MLQKVCVQNQYPPLGKLFSISHRAALAHYKESESESVVVVVVVEVVVVVVVEVVVVVVVVVVVEVVVVEVLVVESVVVESVVVKSIAVESVSYKSVQCSQMYFPTTFLIKSFSTKFCNILFFFFVSCIVHLHKFCTHSSGTNVFFLFRHNEHFISVYICVVGWRQSVKYSTLFWPDADGIPKVSLYDLFV